MTTSPPAPPRRFPGRFFLALGLGLAALGVIGYAVQLAMHQLTTPWYLPILGTLGALLLLVAVVRTRTVGRVVALVLVTLLAGAEWRILHKSRLPEYHGPAASGLAMPAFETIRADGAPFTQRDLQSDQNHVFVFFRGRW